jgi:hypothetical protein
MTEDYRKTPERQEAEKSVDPGIGIWSRSWPLRVGVWILAVIVAIVLALVASAYLSGFESVFAMLTWLRDSLG